MVTTTQSPWVGQVWVVAPTSLDHLHCLPTPHHSHTCRTTSTHSSLLPHTVLRVGGSRSPFCECENCRFVSYCFSMKAEIVTFFTAPKQHSSSCSRKLLTKIWVWVHFSYLALLLLPLLSEQESNPSTLFPITIKVGESHLLNHECEKTSGCLHFFCCCSSEQTEIKPLRRTQSSTVSVMRL